MTLHHHHVPRVVTQWYVYGQHLLSSSMAVASTQQEDNVYQFTSTPNCEDTDSEAFFTPEGSKTYANLNLLKKICGNCAVVNECLDYALKYEVLGYWGNTSEAQRDRLRTKLNIIPISVLDGKWA